MWYTILLTLAFVFIAFVLLAVKVLFVKNGRFPSLHISSNKAMRDKGIGCAVSTDAADRNRKRLEDIL